jgi:hypothetical protein
VVDGYLMIVIRRIKVRLFHFLVKTRPPKQQSIKLEEELLSIAVDWSVVSLKSVDSGHTSAVCWLYGRVIHKGFNDKQSIVSFIRRGVVQPFNFGLGLKHSKIVMLPRVVIQKVIWYQANDRSTEQDDNLKKL